MINKYLEYIMRYLRLRQGMDERDESMDEIFNKWDSNFVFGEVLKWKGLLGGWDNDIKVLILDIYGIDLNELEDHNETNRRRCSTARCKLKLWWSIRYATR